MLHLNLTTFCPLRTPRLRLRQLTGADAETMLFLRSDAETIRHLGKAKMQTLAEARQFLVHLEEQRLGNESIIWGLCRPQNPAILLGTITLWNMQSAHHWAEIGYILHRDCWGQGLMGEAVAEVLRHGFEELRLHRLVANLAPENAASAQLLERQGFAREGLLRQDFYFEGQFSDTLVYGLLAPATAAKSVNRLGAGAAAVRPRLFAGAPGPAAQPAGAGPCGGPQRIQAEKRPANWRSSWATSLCSTSVRPLKRSSG